MENRAKKKKKSKPGCVKDANHINAAPTSSAIRNNGVFKLNRRIGSVFGITDAGKESRVWERRERIMTFSKSDEGMWRNLSLVLCFSLSTFHPPFSLFNFLYPSLLSLLSSISLVDKVLFLHVFSFD